MNSTRSGAGVTLLVIIFSALTRAYWRSTLWRLPDRSHRAAPLVYMGPSNLSVEDHLKHGTEALEAKNADEAVAAFSDAIRADPARAEPYVHRALAYLVKQDYEQGPDRLHRGAAARSALRPGLLCPRPVP